MKVCSVCRHCYDDSVFACNEENHPSLSDIRPGSCDLIQGYRLEYLIETGLKGEIYLACQIETGFSCNITIRSVAEHKRELFLSEASKLVSLFHPNVADVYEIGSLNSGEFFIVSEEPSGQTLRDLLNNVGVPQLLTTIQVIRQAAEALHAIHLNDLVHRAVKPENIILTTDTEQQLLVRIQHLDIGGASGHSITSNKFLIDSALDSIRYFAPEQCSGTETNAQTDVYGLGIVLFEMLAGSVPFDAPNAAGLIQKHRNQSPPEVAINSFDLRMLITHTLMASLQKQPGKRQSTANAFARQLRHIEQLATHSPTPPPAVATNSASLRSEPIPSAAAPAKPFAVAPVPVVKPFTVAPANNHGPTVMANTAAAAVATPQLAISPPELEIEDTIRNESIDSVTVSVQSVESIDSVSEHLTSVGPPPVVLSPTSRLRPSRLKNCKKRVQSAKALDIRKVEVVEPPAEIKIEIERARTVYEQVEHFREPVPLLDLEQIPVRPLASEPLRQSETVHETILPTEPESVQAASILNEPRKIEWNLPEDDIPSEADVMSVLANEGHEVEGFRFDVPDIQNLSPKIDLAEQYDIPQPFDSFENYDASPEIYEAPRASFAAEVRSEIATIDEDDELETITLVEPRRIQIDIGGRPAATPQALSKSNRTGQSYVDRDLSFYPTILGSARAGMAAQAKTRGPNLGVYSKSRRSIPSLSYRGFMIGGGFLVVTLTFLIANFVAGDNIVSGRSNEYNTTPKITKQAQQTEVAKQNEVEITPSDVPTSPSRQTVDLNQDTDKIKPIKISADTAVTNDTTSAPETSAVSVEKPKAAAPSPKNDQSSMRSTLVISSKNGKLTSTVEPESESKRSSGSKKPANVTRPRIVEDSKPENKE